MRKIGIIMYGVTGRMGANQHLGRSIAAIRKRGGVQLSDQSTAFQIQFCWAAMRANFRPLRHNGVSADGAPTCRNVSPMHNIFVDRFPSTKSTLPAPMLLSPQNESVLNQYPRKTELKWKAIPGAVSYVVQVDIRGLTENGTWYW